MNINSKRKKNPGKEIKHLLFFIVGKVAILWTFFDWRKSMYCTLKFEHWKNCIQSSGVDWLEFFVPVSKYQDVPGYSGNIRENIGFRPKQVNRLVQEKKTKKKKRQLKNIPKRAHHLRRCQVFSVASVYPIVPTAPSSSSSSRLLYPDVTSLLLMNFLITMLLFFFFFFFDKMPFVFFNCALWSFCLISVPNPLSDTHVNGWWLNSS